MDLIVPLSVFFVISAGAALGGLVAYVLHPKSEPFVGRYKIVPVPSGFIFQEYRDTCFGTAVAKRYVPLPLASCATAEECRKVIEHLNTPVEVIA